MTKSKSQVLKEEIKNKVREILPYDTHSQLKGIFDLFESSLTQQKSEIIKWAEGKKAVVSKSGADYERKIVGDAPVDVATAFLDGYNKALKDVIEQLKKCT